MKKPMTELEWALYRYRASLEIAAQFLEDGKNSQAAYSIIKALEELPAIIRGEK